MHLGIQSLRFFHRIGHRLITDHVKALIEKYGGTHHGYFIPSPSADDMPSAKFSFPGLGTDGPDNIAVALFSFPTVEAYERYRRDVAEDEECIAATMRFNESPSFLSYERNFLKPIFK